MKSATRKAPAAGRAAPAGTNGKAAAAAEPALAGHAPLPQLPEAWRPFVGRWFAGEGCQVSPAARGDWEIELSESLRKRWRRQRVRLVFDPLRATLPRGAWFTAPGSGAGRRVLDLALARPLVTHRTALAQVPGAPEAGLAAVCRVRGLTWGPARLGPVRYERRIAFHAIVTRWGGLPIQEPWVILMDREGGLLETVQGRGLADVRTREGLYQISGEPGRETRERWMRAARAHFDALMDEREREWETAVGRLREDELERLGEFFSARIEEEEERQRRRTTHAGDESDLTHGDATSLKLEWERRAAEVRHRWALRTEIRLWGIEEWSWPVAELEQELRAGAVHVRLHAVVDVARGLPALPGCPSCGNPAEMLVRSHGHAACVRCARA
jgi:hypothetical protein